VTDARVRRIAYAGAYGSLTVEGWGVREGDVVPPVGKRVVEAGGEFGERG